MIKRLGFTLIELLVVIGLLAVIAAGVVALINPVEKTRQANDANAQQAIGQVATALQSYAAQRPNGDYPTTVQTLQQLVTSGELVALPNVPTGYGTYGYNTAGTPPTTAEVHLQLQSAKFVQGSCAGQNAWWYWNSANGRACGVCQAAAPTTATNTCTF